MMRRERALGKHHHRLDPVQPRTRFLPEVGRHHFRNVAPEPVDPDILHPPAHHVDHETAQTGLVVVEVGDVGPIRVRRNDLPGGISCEPFGMFLDELAVPRRMVRYQVDDELHAAPVGGGQEVLEIVHRSEFGIDPIIIPHGIGAAECSLPVLLADRIDRHQPEDRHAEVLQFGESFLQSGKVSFGGERAEVDRIDRRVLHPWRALQGRDGGERTTEEFIEPAGRDQRGRLVHSPAPGIVLHENCDGVPSRPHRRAHIQGKRIAESRVASRLDVIDPDNGIVVDAGEIQREGFP